MPNEEKIISILADKTTNEYDQLLRLTFPLIHKIQFYNGYLFKTYYLFYIHRNSNKTNS